VFPFQLLVAALCGWLQQELEKVIAFLREENRVLKARLEGIPPFSSNPRSGESQQVSVSNPRTSFVA
jgi:hypothetical protein